MITADAPARASVPSEERWDDTALFETPRAWDATWDEVAGRLEPLRSFRGTLHQGPERLASWLALAEGVARDLGRLRVYASMASSVDTDDEPSRERADRVVDLSALVDEATAWAAPELHALGSDVLRTWVRHPALADRDEWLRRLERDAPHVREPEVEALLGALSVPFAGAPTAHGLLANAELDVPDAIDAAGGRHAVTQSRIGVLTASPDRTLRESAWKNYADAHLARRRTMASMLATGTRQTNLLARTRRHRDALDMTLAPLEVPRGVVDDLLDRYRHHLPIWHRYFELRRRHLGLATLRPWDVNAPLSSAPPHVPYERSVDWLSQALTPLGDEYVKALRRGALEERWVDRAPNRGKRMGAFSSAWAGTPPYIMMSYTDDLGSTSTLAHELGHSMHSYLCWRRQPYPYARYTLFAAEVASNFHQAMLREHLLRTNQNDRDLELALVDEAMSNFGRYLLIMPTLMRFELELHERADRGTGLSADALNERMADLFAEAYGPAMTLDRDRVGITWAQFHTHLYARFYVFQYATGIAGAHAFARRIFDGVPGAAESYLDFLSEGGRTPPLEAMARAGVDLSGPAPLDEAFRVLDGHVDRLERWLEEPA